MQDIINIKNNIHNNGLDNIIVKFICTVKSSELVEKFYKCHYCQDSKFLPYLNEKTGTEHVARCYCMEEYKIDEYNQAIETKIAQGVKPEIEKELKLKIRFNESFKKFIMFSQIMNYSEERFKIEHTEYLLIRDKDGNKLYPHGYLDYYLEYKYNFFKKLRNKGA